ncbi:polyphosphate kinase 2 [Parvibaculum sp.]|jgi:polyphosphate kinase|uniref:polyphosphate kinase 2 n=1 Tax=Parvibaculum sp. TaxID=2024848 RepID=UPI000C4CEB58|nr:polyphosphate kinase 2 [Parvibaculum sp.]MAM94904.1 polyphosphate kinase 2 [Parvibaculum sp.]|tara:strand:- start:28487 stop:29302 length:816 start_codon:yes stop_codon:yes gene_type:complete
MPKTRKTKPAEEPPELPPELSHKEYKDELYRLQVELVKLQRDIIAKDRKVLVILEGRDAAGKDGVVKRIVQHLSPRETRVVALGKPSDRQQSEWYFQRYTEHLPAAQELVLFNRSWYNRAGVERVMGFCDNRQYERFMMSVPQFEDMIVGSGIMLMKYYLDISKPEQKKRLDDRRKDPLKQWKISPIDEVAIEHWKDYSKARDAMLGRTHIEAAPWSVVRADSKRHARLNIIRDLLCRIGYRGKPKDGIHPDHRILMRFEPALLQAGVLAK